MANPAQAPLHLVEPAADPGKPDDEHAERERLSRRLDQDRRMLGRALGDLAGVLGSPQRLRTVEEAELHPPADPLAPSPLAPDPLAPDPLIGACQLLGRAQGFTVHALPEVSGEDFHSTLARLCDASRLRRRRVLLRDDWWRHDNGPLLAFLKDEGGGSSPVALLPVRRRRYLLVDPATGIRRRVDRELARELDTEAIMFYTPLPDGPLAAGTLLQAGLRGRGRDLVGLLAILAAAGLLALLVPLVTRRLIAHVIPQADRPELLHLTLALIIGAVAAAIFQVLRGTLVLRLAGKLDASLQAAVWDRLLALPVSFFRRFTIGDLESRSMGIDHIRGLLTGQVLTSLLSLIFSTSSFTLLFYFSWRLALVASALLAALAVFTGAIAWLQLRHQRALLAVRGKLASLVFALLGGVGKLRTGQAEVRAYSEWARHFAEQRRHTVAAQRLANVQTVAGTVHGVGSSLILFAVVGLSAGMDLDIATFLAFAAAFGQFQSATFTVIQILPTVLSMVPIYERMSPILLATPEVERNQQAAGPLAGDVRLHQVCFRYDSSGAWVLDDISLEVRAGEFVALVGPSGSGKSTCLRLILGFEQPEAGTVCFDGQDLSALDVQSVRRQIGAVLQNGRPLVGDIFNNIVGGRNLTLDDAWRAAREVGLDEEIAAMPMGMHTFINQRGTTFSGGQRQRILIARAIVNRPRIVLLDEATSALDNRSQELVIRSLEKLRATRIVIAHRLSTVRNADRIYVLDHGRVVEAGTYDELTRKAGFFHRMAHRQLL